MRKLFLASALISAFASSAERPYGYFLTGNAADVSRVTRPGYALIGGSTDVEAFYRWLIRRSGGGDFVVVRASGTDGYNDYLYKLGQIDSVETLVIASAAAAHDPAVVRRIRNAEALFIAGGDQWKYVSLWNHSPVNTAIQSLITRGVPVGGTSAGLAILGEYVFTAEKDTVTSPQALANPFDEHLTIGKDFLHIAALKNTITDSHFRARDRMGRSLAFLARMLHDDHLPEARGIAVDERTAALLEPDGQLQVAGFGHIYFLRARKPAGICEPGKPLTMSNIDVYRAGAGGHFDLSQWRGSGGEGYHLSVTAGIVASDQPGGAIY